MCTRTQDDSRLKTKHEWILLLCHVLEFWNMLDLYFLYVPFSERRCPWKCLCKWGSSCIWTLLARMLICCYALARPKMRLDQVGCINQSFWLCECGWFESFRYLLLTSVVFLTSGSTLSCVEHGPPWLAGHRSDSLAHVQKSCNNLSQIWRCRAFWPMIWRERGRLDGLEWEYLEMVGENLSLDFFLEFELGMPLGMLLQVAYINEPNQPEGNQLPEVWLGSRFCGPWVCRCLFYFTFQWFLYYQDDLPISSLSNVCDKCFQFFHDLLAGIPRRTKLPVEALLVTLVCAKFIPTIDVSISRCGWLEWLPIMFIEDGASTLIIDGSKPRGTGHQVLQELPCRIMKELVLIHTMCWFMYSNLDV